MERELRIPDRCVDIALAAMDREVTAQFGVPSEPMADPGEREKERAVMRAALRAFLRAWLP